MRIRMQRMNDNYHLVATNEAGNTVSIDGSPAIGGEGKGARPMEVVLMGLGGCSSIDIISILKKQRQPVRTFSIEMDGEREEGKAASVFSKIHLHYALEGDLDADKVRRAIALSLDTYCSVAKMLEKTAEITYSFEVNGERYAQQD